MDLASLKPISIFLIHVFHACVKIAAQGLNTLSHAEGTRAGALGRLYCCSPGSAETSVHGPGRPIAGLQDKKLLGDFRHPRGALPKCQVSPSLGSRASQTPACPPRRTGTGR